MFPDLPGSDQWTTSIYSKHASAIVKCTDTDLDQLNVPRVRIAVGSRAFPVAAPGHWNEPPLENTNYFPEEIENIFFWSGFSDVNPQTVPDYKRKLFWNYESDYKYVCRASELGSPRI